MQLWATVAACYAHKKQHTQQGTYTIGHNIHQLHSTTQRRQGMLQQLNNCTQQNPGGQDK